MKGREEEGSFLSKEYLFLQFSYLLDMFRRVSLSYIRNLEKGTGLVFLGFSNEVGQNVVFNVDLRFVDRDISGLFVSENRVFYGSLGIEVKF